MLVLMSIELMLNAVNINLIGYSAFGSFGGSHTALGQVIIVFVITIAAAELALAIAIILRPVSYTHLTLPTNREV